MTINIKAQTDRVFKEHIKKAERAKVIALNRAGRSALSQTVRFIREKYNIKASDLKDQIKIIPANKTKDVFVIKASHKAIGLIKFGSARQTKKGVAVSVSKGNRKTINSAFITEVGKGYHRGVFKRETKKRLPIKELYGPSVMQVMSSGKAEEFIQKVFNERFEKELKQALIYGS